jgi:hypothetical protein
MNIWSPEGSKIKFTNPTAAMDEGRHAQKYLKLNEVYTIQNIEVGDSFTDVWLEELPELAFNSCHFENVDPVDPEIAEEREKSWRYYYNRRN